MISANLIEFQRCKCIYQVLIISLYLHKYLQFFQILQIIFNIYNSAFLL